MQNIITVGERHGLLIVFLNVLLSQGGLPLPVVPTLMTVAALARQNPYQITQIILAVVGGALIADAALYWCGLHYGQRFLALLCRLSFSPDFCVRRTEEVFARAGSWSLLLAKFIPGLSHGQNPQILVTDGIGGSPYGPSTLAGTDGSRQPVEAELTTARNLGSRLARVAGRLKDLRVPQ